jgi:hypothetical protein
MRTRAALTAVACLSAAFAAGCASKGYHKSEDLADSIHGTVAAVDAYGTSRAAACTSMNAMIAEPLENLPARFEVFNADVDRVVSADGSLRGAIASMKSSAQSRYKSWGEENLAYNDNDMQVRSQRNRAEAREAFLKLVEAADAMLERSASFVTYLSDFRKVLFNDLSPKGVASVTDFAAKARVSNGQLEDLVGPVRTSLGAAADSMTSKTTQK